MINTFFAFDVEHLVKLISVSLIVSAQMVYLIKLSRKTEAFRPSIVSWAGWAVLMGTSFVSQFRAMGWTINLAGLLSSTIGCILIAFSAKFIFRHSKFQKEDLLFFYVGLGCIIIYLLFSDPWITTIIAIITDFIFGIPLLKSAFKTPEAEKAPSWPLALFSWIFTMIMLTFNFSWIYTLWPIYLIMFNGTMTFLTYVKPGIIRRSNG